MEDNEEIRKEDKIDIKAALSKLVDEEPVEVSQEEAIKSYKETNRKKYSNASTDSEDDDISNQEEEEHLKRVKHELLSSLKRVEDLANKIFVNKEGRRRNIVKDNEIREVSKSLQKEVESENLNKNIQQKESDDERTL